MTARAAAIRRGAAPGQAASPGHASPRLVHGLLLIMGSWCTVLASGALAPVLPQMKAAFSGTPQLDLMIGFVATMPALAVALFAVPVGRLADRVGLTQVMLSGLAIYGVAGVVPFWLDSLHIIIAARFLVGIGEAAVMIASTALIGRLFEGAQRTRWLGVQVAAANFLGIAVLLGGGVLGLGGWHAPFLIYSFALILLAPCALTLPRPPGMAQHNRHDAGNRPAGLRLLILESCLLIYVASVTLLAVIVQSGFLFQARGATDSAQIGVGMAVAATGIAIGATAGGMLARWSVPTKVRLAFFLMGGGLVAIMTVNGVAATAAAASIAGLGSGLIIPALLSRLLDRVPSAMLGGVTGIWIASTFVGQFSNPPLFIVLRAIGGSQAVAMGLLGGFCLCVAAALPLLMRSEAIAGLATKTDTLIARDEA